MIRLCQSAGLPEPEFSIRGGFVTTIWRESKENQGELAETTGEGKGKTTEKITGKTTGKTSGKTSGKSFGKPARAILDIIRYVAQINCPRVATLF